MKEFKGTEWPWKIHSMDRFQVVGKLVQPEDISYDSFYPGIVNTNSNGTYVSMPFNEKLANAKLISVAPELLKSLSLLVSICEAGLRPLSEDLEKSRSIINKALS